MAREFKLVNMSSEILQWQKQKQAEMNTHLEKCRDILLAADFKPERIQTTIHDCEQGVARDLLHESRIGGYGAVVLRRRGTSHLNGLVMGSVALKLLGDIAPLIFAGQKPVNNRFLVAIDGSERSRRALDFVCDFLTGQDVTIQLVNVLRGQWRDESTAFETSTFSTYIEKTAAEVKEKLEACTVRLQKAGFNAGNISTRIIANVESRAGALVELAEKEHFSTIVLGAKGISQTDEFIMGRVSSKLLYVGRQFHVWIVK